MVMIEKGTSYVCAICWTRYATRHEAEECEKRGTMEPKFKVGDEVRIVVTDFANKKFGGKTGIVRAILYHHPECLEKTEAHITRYQVILDMGDDGCYEAIVGEGNLELEDPSTEINE